jgi:hypothetical protein
MKIFELGCHLPNPFLIIDWSNAKTEFEVFGKMGIVIVSELQHAFMQIEVRAETSTVAVYLKNDLCYRGTIH